MITHNFPIKTFDLVTAINAILTPVRFKDYCPNGLQIQGRNEVSKIVTGVTASMELLEAAKEENADAILVHHGYFWRGESEEIVGIKKRRIKFLLENDINLLAYHLPLDVHPVFGNNVQLARVLNLKLEKWAGENNMIAIGSLEHSKTLADFAEGIEIALQRRPQVICNRMEDLTKPINRVAWCTGAAQGYMDVAIANEVDVFISGEI